MGQVSISHQAICITCLTEKRYNSCFLTLVNEHIKVGITFPNLDSIIRHKHNRCRYPVIIIESWLLHLCLL